MTNTGRTTAQFLRFALVGLFGTAAHYGLLIGLVELAGASPVLGSTLGALAGAIVNYILSWHFVFNARRTHSGAFPRFLMTAAVSAGLNGALMALLVNVMGLFSYIPAQVLVTIILSVLNFLVSRYWTFQDGAIHERAEQ